MDVKSEIKAAMEKGTAMLGAKSVIKAAKNGGVSKVICASNAPEIRKKLIKHYAEISGFEVIDFDGSSVELGRLCGKPFGVSLLGIKQS